mmetsp:Transcript_45496/g.115578  ORF Transcript_45496/g.115578 Transcript_45496/m.115578 type:complete len:210 (-) Transcript_45496:24-653(-)
MAMILEWFQLSPLRHEPIHSLMFVSEGRSAAKALSNAALSVGMPTMFPVNTRTVTALPESCKDLIAPAIFSKNLPSGGPRLEKSTNSLPLEMISAIRSGNASEWRQLQSSSILHSCQYFIGGVWASSPTTFPWVTFQHTFLYIGCFMLSAVYAAPPTYERPSGTSSPSALTSCSISLVTLWTSSSATSDPQSDMAQKTGAKPKWARTTC